MVSIRIILGFDFFVVLFAVGAAWMVLGGQYYLLFDVDSMLGGFLGNQQAMTCVQSNLSPIILSNLGLDLSLVAVPLGVVLGLAAFSRWALSLPAGAALTLGGLLWIGGLSGIGKEVGSQLAGCFENSTVAIGPSYGPYVATAAGVLLLASYFLTRIGKLDPPIEGRPPLKTDKE